MRRVLKAVLSFLHEQRYDLLALVGAGLLGGGVWAMIGGAWACILWGLLALTVATVAGITKGGA